MNETDKYAAIIDLPYRKSSARPHMSMYDRAAQFAPFATVTGHGDEIRETERLTGTRHELTEEEAAALDKISRHLQKLLQDGEQPAITVTYFEPDEKKEGGSCQCAAGRLRRIDTVSGFFELADSTKIWISDITDIHFSEDF